MSVKKKMKKKAKPAKPAAPAVEPTPAPAVQEQLVDIHGGSFGVILKGESAKKWGARLLLAIGFLIALALILWLALGLPFKLVGLQEKGIGQVAAVQKDVKDLKTDLGSFKIEQNRKHRETMDAVAELSEAVSHLTEQEELRVGMKGVETLAQGSK